MAGKGKRKKKWFVVCGVVVCIAAGGTFFGVSMHKSSQMVVNAGQLNVKSETVSTGSISNTVEGNGSIEVANTADVTVPTGIKVKSVLVESGDTVTKGQTLATLDTNSIISALAEIEDSIDAVNDSLEEDGLSSLQKKKLKGDRDELKASRKVLRSLRKNPVIVADTDGVIGSVSVSDGDETSQSLSSSSSGSSSSSQGLSNMASSGKITATAMSYSSSNTAASDKTGMVSADTLLCSTAVSETEEADASAEEEKTVITDFSDLTVAKPVTGGKPQSVIKETGDYTGVISWNLATDKFEEQVAYTATVTLTAKEGKVFSKDYTPSLANAAALTTKVSVVDGESVMTVVAKFAKTASSGGTKAKASATKKPDGTTDNSTGSGSKSGNVSSEGNKAESSVDSKTVNGGSAGNKTVNSSNSGSQASVGSTSGKTSAVTSTATKSSTSSQVSTSIYSDSEMVAFTIQLQDSVKVSLSVDELDILSVEKGQTAKVTLDAIEDKEFEGTVTKVSDVASSGNGNAKYEVDITIEKDADMRIGMTASATINVSEANDVLTIPMNALQQKGEETFVYTKQDEDGNLSGETSVETGLSDGQNVEITSGLSEGDTVYYTRTGGSSSSDMNKERGDMPGGDFGGFQKGNMSGGDSGNFQRGNGNFGGGHEGGRGN